ncbi:MAG: hypothetical protein BGO70_10810 [Bacteroidetes bacterium 43-93]|nr:hypothetical protein [Bacteroidota bacterium]OJW95606.1 MAG: hypothetical protein BGO70_10810 [Bacteroidetes bacterium 43-93]
MKKALSIGLATLFLVTGILPGKAEAQRRKKKEVVKEVSIYDIDTLVQPIPLNRRLWHDKIDREQNRADITDGVARNKELYYSEDSTINKNLGHAIFQEIDHMQIMIENMPVDGSGGDTYIESREKIRCLQAINQLLIDFNQDVKPDPGFYRKRVNNLHDLIIARSKGEATGFIHNHISFQTLENVKQLYDPQSAERIFIYTEMGKREPQVLIKRLAEFANDPYADDIVAAAAKVVPSELFNYASSTNYVLSGAVKRSKDPLVQAIVRISQESKSPLRAMPFINDIYSKRLTIQQVDYITAHQDLFYQNLVRLKVENVAIGGDTYTDELQYRGLKYVRDMNDLHEEKDAVRFRCIDSFDAPALYFIMVYGQDEIYTSSFLGTFRRMMERMKPMTGNELLDKVHRDKFRTFIRMCAGYGTLPEFLSTMDAEHKGSIMRDFIAGLEKGKDDDLEDAVDVADAFGSIKDPDLAAFLEKQVKDNYEAAYKARSKKGVIVYGLLATLFEGSKSVDSNRNLVAEQSEKLNLSPINLVLNKNLQDDSGVIYEQAFFYGDEDGKTSYASFLGNFRDGKWKITNTNKYWTTITSTTDKHITIFANLPVPEPGDEEAQKELAKYLTDNNIHPTVIIHRGHSYHLPLTIDNLARENRIVMLGSCGGYHNLGKVLDRAPDAHIISSKQVGSRNVNEPIIKSIEDQIQAGKDIDWIQTWRNLDAYFSAKGRATEKEMFSDYIPPHKNLGAIFIKAYRKMLNSIDEE